MERSVKERYLGFLMELEGAWSADREDRGGRTFCGIAERWNPKLFVELERLVGYKRLADLAVGVWLVLQGRRGPQSDKELQAAELVRRYYSENYLNDLPPVVGIAVPAMWVVLWDMRVNMGWRAANFVCQRALQKLGAGIVLDGVWGPKTDEAFRKYGRDGRIWPLVQLARVRYYLDLHQERFEEGWVERVEKLTAWILKEGFDG